MVPPWQLLGAEVLLTEVKLKVIDRVRANGENEEKKTGSSPKKNSIGEKMPASSIISGDGVLSVDEFFPPRPLLMKPLSPWPRACAVTAGNAPPDEVVT